MQGAGGPAGIGESAVRALAAGADALCLGADLSPQQVLGAHDAIVEAVRAGRLEEERVHEAAGRVAELAAWVSPRPFTDREAGAEAARRALRVEGDPSLGADPLVVELCPDPTIAAGPARHGLGEILGAETIRVREGEQVTRLRDLERVVVVTRDAHRHAWQRDMIPPGTVVVETGVPEWHPPDARAYVATYGAGRANLEAAAELFGRR
jgi:beta-N-acetylhexosaminidase